MADGDIALMAHLMRFDSATVLVDLAHMGRGCRSQLPQVGDVLAQCRLVILHNKEVVPPLLTISSQTCLWVN